MEEEKKQTTGTAPALEKGLDIIELLSQTNKPMRLTEIAEKLGRSKSEIYRMVNVLLERGYLEKNFDDVITLTSKLFGIGLQTSQTRDLVPLASPIIRDLAIKVKNSVYLAVPNRGEVVVVASSSGFEDVNFSLKLGYHRPLLHSHSGLVILAFQTESARKEILSISKQANTKITLTDDLQNQLNAINRDGYLISPSQDTYGVTDIVAPVYLGEKPVAVIAVNHLDRKGEPSEKHNIVLKFLISACTKLSKML